MIFIHGGIYTFCEAGARADIQIKSCQPGRRIAELHSAILIATCRRPRGKWLSLIPGRCSQV